MSCGQDTNQLLKSCERLVKAYHISCISFRIRRRNSSYSREGSP